MKPLLFLLGSAAFAASLSPEGEFTVPHQIAFMAYDSQDCLADKGTWNGDFCVFDTADSVRVKRAEDGSFTVAVSTVTTNAHTCDFEGKGKLVAPDRIEAEADSCRVAVTYGADDTVTVRTLNEDDACRDFCGANASLEIDDARRVK
jgi:hypothetical protein